MNEGLSSFFFLGLELEAIIFLPFPAPLEPNFTKPKIEMPSPYIKGLYDNDYNGNSCLHSICWSRIA